MRNIWEKKIKFKFLKGHFDKISYDIQFLTMINFKKYSEANFKHKNILIRTSENTLKKISLRNDFLVSCGNVLYIRGKIQDILKVYYLQLGYIQQKLKELKIEISKNHI